MIIYIVISGRCIGRKNSAQLFLSCMFFNGRKKGAAAFSISQQVLESEGCPGLTVNWKQDSPTILHHDGVHSIIFRGDQRKSL